MNKFILQCYENWIEQFIPKDEVVGNCTMWARVMQSNFPELTLVGGYTMLIPRPKSDDLEYYFSLSLSCFKYNYHEYLITDCGEIVDPTKLQFDKLLGRGKWCYDRWEEHLIYE